LSTGGCRFMDAAVPVNEGARPTAKRGRQQREADSKERLGRWRAIAV
jgi:hypothetical protein